MTPIPGGCSGDAADVLLRYRQVEWSTTLENRAASVARCSTSWPQVFTPKAFKICSVTWRNRERGHVCDLGAFQAGEQLTSLCENKLNMRRPLQKGRL